MAIAKKKAIFRKPATRSVAKAREVSQPITSRPITSTISSKGQIVIPAPLRRKYRLEEGVTVIFRELEGYLVIEPDRFAAILALRGSLPAEAEAFLIEEKRRECEREDRER